MSWVLFLQILIILTFLRIYAVGVLKNFFILRHIDRHGDEKVATVFSSNES